MRPATACPRTANRLTVAPRRIPTTVARPADRATPTATDPPNVSGAAAAETPASAAVSSAT